MFLKIRYKNVQYSNLVHAHNPFLIFFVPLSFPFSRPFYPRYLLLFTSFLTAIKSWVLIMGKDWKWLLAQL